MDKGTIIRTIALALALLNQILAAKGISPINIEGSQDFIAAILTGLASAWAWWKHNFVTPKAIKQKKVLKQNGLIK